jgi:hypothetical protein
MSLRTCAEALVRCLTIQPDDSRSKNYEMALKVGMIFTGLTCCLVGSSFGEYGETSAAGDALSASSTIIAVPALLVAWSTREVHGHRALSVVVFQLFLAQALLWLSTFTLICYELHAGRAFCANCTINPYEVAKPWQAAAAGFCFWIWTVLAHHNHQVRHSHQAVVAAGLGKPITLAVDADADADTETGAAAPPAATTTAASSSSSSSSSSFLGFHTLATFVLALTCSFSTLLGAMLLFVGAAALRSVYAGFLTESLLASVIVLGLTLFAFGGMGLRVMTKRRGVSRFALPFMVGCGVGMVACASLGAHVLTVERQSEGFAAAVWEPSHSDGSVVKHLRRSYVGMYEAFGCTPQAALAGGVKSTKCNDSAGGKKFAALTLKCHASFNVQTSAAITASTLRCANDGAMRDQAIISRSVPNLPAQETFCQCRGTLAEQVGRYSGLIATVVFTMLAMLTVTLMSAVDNYRRGAYAEIKEGTD